MNEDTEHVIAIHHEWYVNKRISKSNIEWLIQQAEILHPAYQKDNETTNWVYFSTQD